MKKWNTPKLEEVSIKLTAAPVDTANMTSGQLSAVDLGTCSNPYWKGNGMTKEEAEEQIINGFLR